MAAYVIAQLDVTDVETFRKYQAEVPATIAKFGGRYLVRGGDVTPMEGKWRPKRVVVVEFPDMATLKNWYDSEEYQSIIGYRTGASTTELVFVEGV
jgi:uncharacterized protein (DUF1330 family)